MKYVAIMVTTALVMLLGMFVGSIQIQVQQYNDLHRGEEQVTFIDGVWLAAHPNNNINDVLVSK